MAEKSAEIIMFNEMAKTDNIRVENLSFPYFTYYNRNTAVRKKTLVTDESRLSVDYIILLRLPCCSVKYAQFVGRVLNVTHLSRVRPSSKRLRRKNSYYCCHYYYYYLSTRHLKNYHSYIIHLVRRPSDGSGAGG